ncbi:flavodoxin family protein [Cellvibrio sp.]|uniref:flavodoxin family protein n=1 Tax=Cellvibrio sp. TaxID=1965322 RepID=UPI003964824A
MGTILGLSASLRGARQGKGVDDLCSDLMGIDTKEDLFTYLETETKSLAALYEQAQVDGYSQLQNLIELNKNTYVKHGLSNCEAALAAGLWGCLQEKQDIVYCNLSRYFPESGNTKFLEELEEIILKSDGFLLSGPVYFGDRSSIAQEFIEFLSKSEKCRDHVRNKIFGGISVGAKRNGGQETSLIYQLIDLINLNMVGVGNDYGSTSQYGGTVVAGDIGTAAKDSYGLATAIDTGKRVARMTKMLSVETMIPNQKARVEIWLVQDDEMSFGLRTISNLIKQTSGLEQADIVIRDFTTSQIHRCIACDICPISPGKAQEYRCVITKKDDLFVAEHPHLINVDAVLIAAYSPIDRSNINSVYQKFVERTRYLRRDDYALSDVLVAPFVISEINSNQNLHLRMVTSLIRHHTMIHHPVLVYKYQDKLLDLTAAEYQLRSFVEYATKCATTKVQNSSIKTSYNPIGYVISAQSNQIFRSTKRDE